MTYSKSMHLLILQILRYCLPCHELPAVMKRFLEIHNQKIKELHPIISAAQFTANLFHIHPFEDGNGRTGRIFNQILLYNSGYFGCLIEKKRKRKIFRCGSKRAGQPPKSIPIIYGREGRRIYVENKE